MTIGASSPPSVSPSRGATTLRAPGPRDFSGPATPVPGRPVPCEATASPCGCVELAGGVPAFCCGSTMPRSVDGAAATAAGDCVPDRSAASAPGVRPESDACGVFAPAAARIGSDVPRNVAVPPWRVVAPVPLEDRSARFAAPPETSPPITPPGMLGDADRESRVRHCADAEVVVSARGLGAAGGALGGGSASTSRVGTVSTGPPPGASAGGGVRPALVARPSSAGGPIGVSRAVFSDGSRPVGAAVAGADAGIDARAAMSDVGRPDAGICRLGRGSEIGGKTGSAAVAGLGVDGLGVATIADSGSGAAEAIGKSVGAARVSLVGSGKRATVSAGGVGVGSGTRVTGSNGGICDAWEEAEGVVGSGIVASGGEAAATDGITSASPGGWGAGVDRGSPSAGRAAS
jgi:hypothetical protein